jgi:hypothetical protein
VFHFVCGPKDLKKFTSEILDFWLFQKTSNVRVDEKCTVVNDKMMQSYL